MKSSSKLHEDIISTILKIQEEFPELTKYLDEMPENSILIKNKGIDAKDLKAYLESLNELLETYSIKHGNVQPLSPCST